MTKNQINLRKLIKETLEQQLNKSLMLKEDVEISEVLQYHIDNEMTLTENAFSVYSERYFDLVNEVRELFNEGKIELNQEDTLMVESDLGIKVKIGKEYVYLDAPYISETEEDILAEGKTPKKPKKFVVYTKSKTEGVKKITFGNHRLIVKESHKCSQKTDRTTSEYWKCHVGHYSKQLGLSS
jgi:hypothetical protein